MRLSALIEKKYKDLDSKFSNDDTFQNNVINYMHWIRTQEVSRNNIDSYLEADQERRRIHSMILSSLNCTRCGRNSGLNSDLECGSRVCTCTLFGLWIESLMNN